MPLAHHPRKRAAYSRQLHNGEAETAGGAVDEYPDGAHVAQGDFPVICERDAYTCVSRDEKGTEIPFISNMINEESK